MVEESTAASHSLAKEAGELSELASKFEIGNDAAPAVRAVKKPAAPARSAPARSSAPATRPLPTHGNAALKPVAAANEDTWEDF
jgi:methyl-accepting chemotaxis protein